jgi:predicted DCC family thiol-disulfide oxidoreductase YuxK
MATEAPDLTVFYDGSCPLCRAEIGYYARADEEGRLRFIDVAHSTADPACGLSRQQAMSRFHVLRADGTLVSGADAFVTVWRRLPRWRWVAWLAGAPGVKIVLEGAYRLLLRLRPTLSRMLKRFASRNETRI